MPNIFSTNCYACGEEIFGNHNRNGGVFYVDDINTGIYHKRTCRSGYFNDAVQSGTIPIPKHLKLNDQNQLSLFPETKLCRLCWNTNGWVSPSGWEDKAKPGSYEDDNGYGHEEWLFDMEKIFEDGYHYGFLEPVNKFHDKYVGRTYNFILYTIVGTTQQKLWVGQLKNAEVINNVKSKEVTEFYKRNGWLDLMKENLFNSGLEHKNFDRVVKENILFNIRFKPEEFANIYPKPIEIDNVSLIRSPRYNLMDFDELSLVNDVKYDRGIDFNSGSNTALDLANSFKRKYHIEEKELPLKHNDLIKAFFHFLKSEYGNSVKRECTTAGNRRIDILRKNGSEYILYEIKTYNHLETSIRVALGQLIEYSCYPDRKEANKLYLVSDLSPKPDTFNYIKHLNNILNIKFGYIQFDIKTNKILMEI